MKKDKDYVFEDTRGEWGKRVGRDGYSPFTHPVIRTESSRDRMCCNRVIRLYNNNQELTPLPKDRHTLDDPQTKANAS